MSELPFPPCEVPPTRVAWLHPLQLLRTVYHSILSTAGTGLLDRRDVQAAQPPVYDGYPSVTWLRGAPLDDPGATGTQSHSRKESSADYLIPPPSSPCAPIWIDYVADIGDSWDATYATLSTLARSELRFAILGPNGQPIEPGQIGSEATRSLPRGHVLVLGGDQVYPTPSREAYRLRTRSAFMAAFPNSRAPGMLPSLLAIPGNHDWYDGLTAFTREFCRGGTVGAWAPVQGRSYFAVHLSANCPKSDVDWWLLGIDVALNSQIDAAQQRYFIDTLRDNRPVPASAGEPEQPVASQDSGAAFPRCRQTRVILCTAKPVWLDDPSHTIADYRNLADFVDLLRQNNVETTVILAGDTHHYSHYVSPPPHDAPAEEADEHMFVVGGGGSYLSATHRLRPTVLKVARQPQAPVPGAATPITPEMAPQRAFDATQEARRRRESSRRFTLSPLTYPSQAASRRMVRGALWAVFRPENIAFVLLVGLLYAAFASLWHTVGGAPDFFAGFTRDKVLRMLNDPPWAAVTFGLLLVWLCAGFTLHATKGVRWFRLAWGAAHGLVHLVASLWLLSWVLRAQGRFNDALRPRLPELLQPIGIDSVVGHLVYPIAAGVIGAALFALFLVVSERLLGWHTNEVFMVQSIVDYRSFLRMGLDPDGTLTIYPIGLRETPLRWRARPANPNDATRGVKNPALYEPGDGTIEPHLIEAPIVIRPQN